MEMPEVEMGDNTGIDKESLEGLGVKNEEGVDKENIDKGKGKNIREDLVSIYFLDILVC